MCPMAAGSHFWVRLVSPLAPCQRAQAQPTRDLSFIPPPCSAPPLSGLPGPASQSQCGVDSQLGCNQLQVGLFAHSSFFSPSLAACLLAQPLRVGMLLLLTSLSFLLLVFSHTCSLLSIITSQPHGTLTVLSPPCPLKPLLSGSWAQNTLYNLPQV